jgi:hypothetical protein
MGSLPAGSDVVVAVVDPFVSVEVPRTVAPLVNVTVPVAPVVTVAVKVTDCPTLEGLTDEVTETTGRAFVTVCVIVPLAGLSFESPP